MWIPPRCPLLLHGTLCPIFVFSQFFHQLITRVLLVLRLHPHRRPGGCSQAVPLNRGLRSKRAGAPRACRTGRVRLLPAREAPVSGREPPECRDKRIHRIGGCRHGLHPGLPSVGHHRPVESWWTQAVSCHVTIPGGPSESRARCFETPRPVNSPLGGGVSVPVLWVRRRRPTRPSAAPCFGVIQAEGRLWSAALVRVQRGIRAAS